MSTSFATSLDSGHSDPRTPPREQYQKFGFDKCLLLGAFKKPEFFKFLDIKLPKEIPNVDEKRINKDYLVTFANEVAKSIKDKREHYLFLSWLLCQHMIFTLDFPKRDTLVFNITENKRPPGHITDTMYRPNFMAALQPHWKNDVVPWPFVRLAGETTSGGKTHETQKEQAISYLHYLLLARPDLYVAQGLLSSDKNVVFLFGIGGEGIC